MDLQIIPESVDVDLEKVYEKAKEIIEKIGGKVQGKEIKPIAFGLNALVIRFVYPETDFNEESLIESLQSIEGVSNAEIIFITRAL